MNTDQYKYELKERRARQGNLSADRRGIKQKQTYAPFPTITFGMIYRKLLAGLRKLFVALKYQFYRLTAGLFENWKLPWFKIGLAALALFIVTKKDIQFSIDMKAPLGAMADRPGEEGSSDQMSLAHPIGFKSEGSKAASTKSVKEMEVPQVKAYIRRFSKVAVAEMEKYGIPASVKLGQAILESWAGDHPSCKQANNHFGRRLAGRYYDSAWENWRAHSKVISTDFSELLGHGRSYKKWAKGLQKANYNGDKNYDDKLVDVIEMFQLYLLDED